ncbi:hypothetical protein PJP12_29910, partial [Mycobacterium kansasii]
MDQYNGPNVSPLPVFTKKKKKTREKERKQILVVYSCFMAANKERTIGRLRKKENKSYLVLAI